jgi:F420-0:gamma-glutamyl ligase
MEANKRNELLLIARNRNLKVIFTDNNGKVFLIGYSRGAVVSAGTSVTGTAVGDLNGYTLTLTAQEPAMAFEVASPVATTFSGCTFTAA